MDNGRTRKEKFQPYLRTVNLTAAVNKRNRKAAVRLTVLRYGWNFSFLVLPLSKRNPDGRTRKVNKKFYLQPINHE